MPFFTRKKKAPAESSTASAQLPIPKPQYNPRRFGLNQVHPDPYESTQAKEQDFDLVAIHGLNAESPKTWIAWKIDGDPNSGDVHWLKDDSMLPSILPNARIFTYDWNAGTENHAATDILLGHADSLLYRLHIERATDLNIDRPIIWVASCYGGLLLAKALQRASEGNSSYHDILYSTAGIVFLGTPFQGSHKGFYTAAEARLAVALASGAETSGELLKYIQDDATCGGRGELDDVVMRFTQLVAHNKYKIPIECYYESMKTDMRGLVKNINDLPEGFAKTLDENGRAVLVERHSACLQGLPGRQLHVRHSMLTKFASRDDDSFKQIAFTLKEFSQGAREVLKNKNPLNEDTRSITNWLSTINYSAKQNEVFCHHQYGTDQWFLESKEFGGWVQNVHKTLYCPGIPGSGKTTLISVVIDNLLWHFQDDNTIGVAYLYCDAKWENGRSVEDLLLSFLAQLVQRRVPKIVKSLVDDHKKRSSRPKLNEISEVLESVIAKFSRVFIIVDALDELQSDCRKRLLSVLFNILETKNLSFLATSRFSVHVHRKFEASGPILQIRASNSDMQKYLRDQIYQLPNFVRENRQLQEDIITQISIAAGEMFLLSVTYLDSLKDNLTLNAMRAGLKLLQASDNNFKKKDDVEKLNEAYIETVKRINKQNPGFRKLAKQVLSWLTFAMYPISIEELRHALAVEDKSTILDKANFVETSLIISACAGWAEVEKHSGIVQLPHLTIFEFLKSNWFLLDDSKFSLQQTVLNTQCDLTLICISYISLVLLTSLVSDTSKLDLSDSYILYDYAFGNWGHHTREARMGKSQRILDLLQDETFLTKGRRLLRYSSFHDSNSNFLFHRHSIEKPLEFCSYFGLIDTAEIFLQPNYYLQGLDDDVPPAGPDPGTGKALEIAAQMGHTNIVKMFLECKDLESLWNYGSLYFSFGISIATAIRKDHWEIAQLLLKSGYFNTKDTKYLSLLPSVKNGHVKMVQVLLQYGCNANEIIKGEIRLWHYNEHSILWLAKCLHNDSIERLLVEYGAKLLDEEIYLDEKIYLDERQTRRIKVS